MYSLNNSIAKKWKKITSLNFYFNEFYNADSIHVCLNHCVSDSLRCRLQSVTQMVTDTNISSLWYGHPSSLWYGHPENFHGKSPLFEQIKEMFKCY